MVRLHNLTSLLAFCDPDLTTLRLLTILESARGRSLYRFVMLTSVCEDNVCVQNSLSLRLAE